MTPPLIIDRAPIVRARVQKLRARIGQARTTLTIRKAVFTAENDPEIGRDVVEELRLYGETRIGSIRLRRSQYPGETIEVGKNV